MPDAGVLAALVASRISSMRGTAPCRVAIDGRSTAGKSTFAERLAKELGRRGCPVVQVSIDDFHTPGHKLRSATGSYTPETYYDTAFDYDRFRTYVLDPVGPTGDRLIRRRYWNSYDDQPADEVVELVRDDVVLVAEGSFLLRPDFDGYWDFTVWLHVDFDTMITRAVARDTWVGDADAVRARYIDRYIPLHRLYEQRTRADQRADLVINNNDFAGALVLRAPTGWTLNARDSGANAPVRPARIDP